MKENKGIIKIIGIEKYWDKIINWMKLDKYLFQIKQFEDYK